jgi:CHAT domain-containing protein
MSAGQSAEGRRRLAEAIEQLSQLADPGADAGGVVRRYHSALEEVLFEEPSSAAEVQQLALRTIVLLRTALPGAVPRLGELSLRASVLIADPTPLDEARAALLDLYLTEAWMAAGRYSEAAVRLEALDRRLPLRHRSPSLSAYLRAAADCLRGRMDEESCERERAATAYQAALDGVLPLLAQKRQRERLADAWVQVVLGPLDPGQRRAAADVAVRQTLAPVATWALVGRAQAGNGELRPSEVKALVNRATKLIGEFGLPERFGERRLAALHGLLASHAGPEQAVAFSASLSDDVLRAAGLEPASTRPVLDAAVAHAMAADGVDLGTTVLYDAALRAARDSGSKPALARVLGSYLADTLRAPDQENDLIEAFLANLTVWGFGSRTLAEKAEFEAALAAVVEYALELWTQEQSPFRRLRLGLLLDLVKRPQWSPIPTRWNMESIEGTPTSLYGMWVSMDWFGRLQRALGRRRRTAVIVVQSVRDRTVFCCVTPGDQGLLAEVVWHEDQQATSQLATAAREEFDFLEMAGGVASEEFTELCKAAFLELPDGVRQVVRDHQSLVVVPDARTDAESVPLELMHDGEGHLGLRRVIAFVPSLRAAARVVEGGQPPPSRRRGLVAAAPFAAGAPPLLFAAAEAEHVRQRLEELGWDVPLVDEGRLGPKFLVDRLQHVAVSHLAAHGTSTVGDEVLVLPNGQRMGVQDLASRRPARVPFVYLNTCSLGATRYVGGGARRGIAHALVELGAPAVVANLSPVDDQIAAELSAAFYQEAFSHPVGEALRRAKLQLAERGVAAPMWGTTVLLGDPELRLQEGEGRRAPRPVLSDRLLDAFANPERDQGKLDGLTGRAMRALEDDPDDSRLRGALMLLDSIQTAEEADDRERATELHFAVELADTLGHPATAAMVRIRAGEDLADQGRTQEALETLESALPMLDSLNEVDQRWRQPREQTYGVWKQLDREVSGEGRVVLEVDGTEEEIALQVNALLGSQAIVERGGEDVGFRLPEGSLEDVAWNAVLVGHPSRFRRLGAQAEVAGQLCGKLVRMGALPEEGVVWAETIVSGLLPYLWHGLSPLSVDVVRRSAAVLLAAVTDAGTRWTEVASAPWFEPMEAFRAEVESSVRAAADVPARRQAWLRKSRQSLAGRWVTIAASLQRDHPRELATCSAYALGCVVQAPEAVEGDGPAAIDAAGNLHGLFSLVEGVVLREGQLKGYQGDVTGEDELDRWRREDGLAAESATAVRFAD